jgi:hypothetical protein
MNDDNMFARFVPEKKITDPEVFEEYKGEVLSLIRHIMGDCSCTAEACRRSN